MAPESDKEQLFSMIEDLLQFSTKGIFKHLSDMVNFCVMKMFVIPGRCLLEAYSAWHGLEFYINQKLRC